MTFRRSSIAGAAVRVVALAALTIGLAACNSLTRLSQIGETPPLTQIQNPAQNQPQVVMPMPAPVLAGQESNSLWRTGARAFSRTSAPA